MIVSSSPKLRDIGLNLQTLRNKWLQVFKDDDIPPIMVEHNGGQEGSGHFAGWVATKVTMQVEGLNLKGLKKRQ